MPAHRDQVLESVEVHVEEGRTPGPVGRGDAGEVGDLGPRPIAAPQVQHVAHPLRPRAGETHRLGQGRMRRDHRLPFGERRAQHVDGEEVDRSVAVHVTEVDRHAGVARGGQRPGRYETEVASAVVDPELVGVLEVVADVEIGGAVAIHIVEARRQREEVGLGGERHARLVAKARATDRRVGELAVAIVDEEEIGIGALRAHDATEIGAVLDPILLHPLRLHRVAGRGLGDDLIEGTGLRRVRVERVADLVRGHVEVEVAVAINVSERHGGRGVTSDQAACCSTVGEVALAVVEPERDGAAVRADEQIGVAVVVDVGESRAGRGE